MMVKIKRVCDHNKYDPIIIIIIQINLNDQK